jgi:hypothetical protein
MPSVIAALQSVINALLISDACNVQENLNVILQSVTLPSVIASLHNIY